MESAHSCLHRGHRTHAVTPGLDSGGAVEDSGVIFEEVDRVMFTRQSKQLAGVSVSGLSYLVLLLRFVLLLVEISGRDGDPEFLGAEANDRVTPAIKIMNMHDSIAIL